MNRILKTLCWIIIYCSSWQIIKLALDGCITNRPVDNIIMLLFIPMIYKAMEPKHLSDTGDENGKI